MNNGDRVKTPAGVGTVLDQFYDNYGDAVVVDVDGAELTFEPDEIEP